VRFKVRFGLKELAVVSVDVVASANPPRGAITTEPLLPPFKTSCTSWPDVRMFPLEDHTVEKICALYERHRTDAQASTRYKDLVDLILIALKSPLPGALTHAALQSEVTRRVAAGRFLPAGHWSLDTRAWT
jgi:hypothetical protein